MTIDREKVAAGLEQIYELLIGTVQLGLRDAGTALGKAKDDWHEAVALSERAVPEGLSPMQRKQWLDSQTRAEARALDAAETIYRTLRHRQEAITDAGRYAQSLLADERAFEQASGSYDRVRKPGGSA